MSLSLLIISLLQPRPALAADPHPSLQTQPVTQRTWKSVFGLSLAGAGLVSVGTGVARLLQSNDFASREAQYSKIDSTNIDDSAWLINEGRAARTQSLLLISLGAAAVIGGTLLYALDTPNDVNVSVMLDGKQTGLVISGTW